MKVCQILNEMSNITISGPGEPPVLAWCSSGTTVQNRHQKRIKVKGTHDSNGVILWGSKKQPIGKIDRYTLDIATKFITTYQFLLDALWDNLINYDQFESMYFRSKQEGIQAIQHEIALLMNK